MSTIVFVESVIILLMLALTSAWTYVYYRYKQNLFLAFLRELEKNWRGLQDAWASIEDAWWNTRAVVEETAETATGLIERIRSIRLPRILLRVEPPLEGEIIEIEEFDISDSVEAEIPDVETGDAWEEQPAATPLLPAVQTEE